MSQQFPSDLAIDALSASSTDAASRWLLLALGEESLTYVVSNRQQEVLAARRYLNTAQQPRLAFFRALRQSDALLQATYALRQVVLYSPTWSLAGGKSLRPGEEEPFLAGLYPQLHGLKVLVDAVAPFPVKNLFADAEELLQGLQEDLPELGFRHHMTQVIRHANRAQQNLRVNRLGVLAASDHGWRYALLRNGDLAFANTYPLCAPADLREWLQAVHAHTESPSPEVNLLVLGTEPWAQQAREGLKETYPKMQAVRNIYPNQPALEAAGLGPEVFCDLIIP